MSFLGLFGAAEPTLGSDLAGKLVQATLDNGMRVVVVERPDLPTVATFVYYRVGSVDEPAGATGMSHFLEHLLFKGTKRLPKGSIDRGTMQRGGANNAFTVDDATAYHFAFAADRWEWALEVEADRMRNTVFDPKEFEAERAVVLEELAMGLDEPWELLFQETAPLLWNANGYRHPIFGWRIDLEAVDVETVRRHYDAFYRPNNAVLVVAGRVDAARVIEKARALFGPIEAREAGHAQPTDPMPRGARRSEVRGPWNLARLLVACRTVPVADPRHRVIELAAEVLAGGRRSRLQKALVQDAGLASSVSTVVDGRIHGGLLYIQVTASEGAERGAIEAVVARELAALAKDGPEDEELERSRRTLVNRSLFEQERAESAADRVGWAASTGTLADLGRYRELLQGVDREAMCEVLAALLDPSTVVTAWALPEERQKDEEAGADPESEPDPDSEPLPLPLPLPESEANAEDDKEQEHEPEPSPVSLPASAARRDEAAPPAPILATIPELPEWKVRRKVLGGGLRLVGAPLDGLGVVAVRVWADAGAAYDPPGKEGLAELTGRVMAERLRARVDELGGAIAGAAGGFGVQLAAEDLPGLLPELAAALASRAIDEKDFARLKRELAAAAAARQDDPMQFAADELARSLYAGHPLGRPPFGTPATVGALEAADVAAFLGRCYRPERTIVAAAGGFDYEAFAAAFARELADWSGEGEAPAALPAPVRGEPTDRRIRRSGEQAQLFLGHLGVARKDPDYVALRVMEHILGRGSGFTDRLSMRLRDEEGLAYYVWAEITSTADQWPGMFRAYIGCRPEQVERARKEIIEEVRRIRDEGVSAAELADVKSYLTGGLVFEAETRDQVAGFLVSAERFGLGFDALRRLPAEVAAVTAEDVQRVARKHLDPEALHVVVVGP